ILADSTLGITASRKAMTHHSQDTHNDHIHGHEIIKNPGTYKVNIPTISTSRDSITIFIELSLSEKIP
ncbi:MAG: hypothetical protein LUQ26_14740, partial [Methylococcaceae bacterium]|nr:hypothetical protein [Methylococcaceae bacterium]